MIEQACAIVYEKLMGKCWHRSTSNHLWLCSKCNKVQSLYMDIGQRNPPLATSLDAWRPIWEAMNAIRWDTYDMWIKRIIARKGIWVSFTYDPMHHLEASLRTIGEDELAEKVRESCQ